MPEALTADPLSPSNVLVYELGILKRKVSMLARESLACGSHQHHSRFVSSSSFSSLKRIHIQ